MSTQVETVEGLAAFNKELLEQITDHEGPLGIALQDVFDAAQEVTLSRSGKTQDELLGYIDKMQPVEQGLTMLIESGLYTVGDLAVNEDYFDPSITSENLRASALLGPVVVQSYLAWSLPLWNWFCQIVFDVGPQLSDFVSEETAHQFLQDTTFTDPDVAEKQVYENIFEMLGEDMPNDIKEQLLKILDESEVKEQEGS